MTKSKVSSSSNNGQSKDRKVDASHTDALVTSLKPMWHQHHQVGLDVRLKTGLLLNEQLGTPEQHFEHGRKVIKRCTEVLGVSQPELSRMRWFAFHFKSLDEMAANHPGLKSWKQVKEILPRLRTGENSTAREAKVTVTNTVKSLNKAKELLSNVKADKPEQEQQLREAFIQLIEAAKHLGIDGVRSDTASSVVPRKAVKRSKPDQASVETMSASGEKPDVPTFHEQLLSAAGYEPETVKSA